ncbi:hypothetical protein FEP87_02493 [Burkholderia multivorans]|nr:hypothetical protein [Burkholderia multivorans]MDR8856214.1 hypothetical protein [Burkholderia multivorans]
MGIVVGEYADEEIWREIEKKADNHASYVSANPEDYPDSDDIRMADLRVSTTLSFKEGGRHAVEYWPVPTIVWGATERQGK